MSNFSRFGSLDSFRNVKIATGAALATLALAACGGESPTATTSPTTSESKTTASSTPTASESASSTPTPSPSKTVTFKSPVSIDSAKSTYLAMATPNNGLAVVVAAIDNPSVANELGACQEELQTAVSTNIIAGTALKKYLESGKSGGDPSVQQDASGGSAFAFATARIYEEIIASQDLSSVKCADASFANKNITIDGSTLNAKYFPTTTGGISVNLADLGAKSICTAKKVSTEWAKQRPTYNRFKDSSDPLTAYTGATGLVIGDTTTPLIKKLVAAQKNIC